MFITVVAKANHFNFLRHASSVHVPLKSTVHIHWTVT